MLLYGMESHACLADTRPRIESCRAYGTTGTGVEQGKQYRTLKRDFDGASGIKVNGDFYRLRTSDTGMTELPAGTEVTFERFDGTTAVVHTITKKEQ